MITDMNENIERILDELDDFWVANEMTYEVYSRLHDLISELDNLLKAQVMTPNEVSAVKQNSVIWCEWRISKSCEPLIRRGNDFKNDLRFLLLDEVTDCDDYLKNYRCWTSQPTDEQRETVKWK